MKHKLHFKESSETKYEVFIFIIYVIMTYVISPPSLHSD